MAALERRDEGLHAAVRLRTDRPALPVLARQLVVSEAAVGKHIGSILAKLDLPPADDTHRRVLAVLAFLRS